MKQGTKKSKSVDSIKSIESGKSVEIIEGSARLCLEGMTHSDPANSKGAASTDVSVFYNPAMKFNRDVTLLLLHALNQKKIRVALPLAASGVRAIRILKELPSSIIEHVSCNDISQEAYDKMQELFALNKIQEKKITVMKKDADLFFEESLGFEYIDIDPFGSPRSFLPAAIKRLSRGGILAVTATDTSALTGTYLRTTRRKYWSCSMKNELMHELSVRILIRSVQLIATLYDKALTPVYSYARKHYVRVFFGCEKGRKPVDALIAQHQYVVYDTECLQLHATPIGEIQSGHA